MTDIRRPGREQLRGTVYGLAAAGLFGLSTPLAKRMLPDTGPLVLTALLYLGAGIGLLLLGLLPGMRREAPRREAPLRASDIGLLVGITVTGGIIGPVLMLVGLARVSGVVGSLLLNLEAPFTMLLALVAFGEHLGRRAAGSAVLILVGALVLTYQPGEMRGEALGVVAIAAACLTWAIDNNLTQRLSLRDPIAVVRIKALGAGLGALAAVPLLGESLHTGDLLGMAVMALGVGLLLRERHSHPHTHEVTEHEHLHIHDEHHAHSHAGPVDEPHAHWHRHDRLTHEHPHVSDAHHRHPH